MSIDNLTMNKPNSLREDMLCLMLGYRRLYSNFVEVLNQEKEGISAEKYRGIVDRIDSLISDMFLEIRESSFLFNMLLNWPIIRRYRIKIRQDQLIGEYVRMAESY